MAVDYPGALDYINDNPVYVFVDALLAVPNEDLTIMCHKTASGGRTSAEALARYFNNNADRVTAHFVVGKDGTVYQCVSLKDGAGANGVTELGFDTKYWQPLINKYGNPNRCSISIEAEDWTRDNSDPMPAVQTEAYFKLVLWLCRRYNIGIERIKGHNTLLPVQRARCPGPTFDFQRLFKYIEHGGNSMQIPSGWKDDGKTLTAPNGVPVVLGFREYVLSHNWDTQNVPLAPEESVEHVEDYYPSGKGARQGFNFCFLGYVAGRGIWEIGTGHELDGCRRERDKLRSEVEALKNATPLPPATVATIGSNVATIIAEAEKIQEVLK